MNFSEQEDIHHKFHFDYNSRFPECELEKTNSYVSPVSDNLYLRLSPERKYCTPIVNCDRQYHTNVCHVKDYCCNFIYQPEPCEKCIGNHCNHLHSSENSSIIYNSNNLCSNNTQCHQYASCTVCHNVPCCCCTVCHFYPCKCCRTCHSLQCKCCPKCHTFPCLCCKVCNSPMNKCLCCKRCKKYPCQCCPVCHFEECCCCQNCRKYPCECCPKCHFPNCRCCTVCCNYPCTCCSSCHMAKCICCEQCNSYPCKCCPDCHFVNCQCCVRCGGYPCRCVCDNKCNCCQTCVNLMCQNCKNNPCICCPYCNFNPCQNHGCTCGKECIAMNLNAMNSLKCPTHNSHAMKHNPGCPFGAKCTHGPKCAHPKDNNMNTQNSNSDFNNNSQNMNNQSDNNYPGNKNNCPNNKNMIFHKNPYYYNNNSNENENEDDNNQNNQNFINDSNYAPNNNNGPYNNKSPNFQNQNNNNQNDFNPNENNPNKSCPLSPINSPFPPNSPFFNLNEPNQDKNKNNWIFCTKCNIYHRCPHPGCEHNPNTRTTTHKCLHENNPNNFSPNINNQNKNQIYNDQGGQGNSQNNQGEPNTDINQSRKSNVRPKQPPRKRDVFSSCPYQEELGQFVDFLGYLMEVESKIEDLKIELARRNDFNFEDIFRIFEVDGKGYIEPEDLKQGLKLLGLNPTDYDIKLLIKRFDLNQQGLLSYTDFFDMVVSFEKKMRNSVQIRPPNSCCPCKSPDVFECDTLIAIKNLLKFIIECERDINNMRKDFDSLRSKYSEVVQFLDVSRRGVINRSDLKLYLTQFNKFTTSKECDLLFIRLDKTRSGEVGIDEIENELMFLR